MASSSGHVGRRGETMRRSLTAAFLLPILLSAPGAAAQTFPRDDDQDVCASIDFLMIHGQEMGISDPTRQLRRSRVVREPGGESHARFDQLHQGLPVFGRQLIVHLDQHGEPQSMGGNYAAVDVPVATHPAITSDEAARSARQQFPGLEGWRGELLLLPQDDELVLVYRVVLKAEEPPARIVAFVDAVTGALVDSYDDLQTAHDPFFGGHPAVGKSLYTGEVTLVTEELTRGCSTSAPTPGSCPFALRDSSRGLLRTLDMQDRFSGDGVIFSDLDNVWGDTTTADRASAGVDAHFGAEMAFDYFLTAHGRNGIFDDGRGPVSRMHFGTDENNAYWDSFCKCPKFGDGDGSRFGPLVSLDIVGHEMMHGITEATAGLFYRDQSGALNESMSDIFGTMVEFFAAAQGANTVPDYWIFEDFYTPGTPGDAVRYMDDPTRDHTNPTIDNGSIDSFLDYHDGMDVHLSSGIANNVFYLLAEGGRHRKIATTAGGNVVIGVGKEAAAKIFYRALLNYMVPPETFDLALEHTLRSATDLFGADSPEVASVCKAWKVAAVGGVPCATCPKGGVVPPHLFEDFFRSVNDYAGRRGYGGGFRNFHEAIYDGCTVYGTILLHEAGVEGRDVLMSELGNPTGAAARFRAVHDYAAARGFVGGFPNFHEAETPAGTVYGTILLRSSAAEWRDVLASELGHPNGPEERFRAVNDYAVTNGFVGGFPNFHEAETPAGTFYGTILIKRTAAEWRDVAASGLP